MYVVHAHCTSPQSHQRIPGTEATRAHFHSSRPTLMKTMSIVELAISRNDYSQHHAIYLDSRII